MELQSFINSGLLESFALGQCTDEERRLVMRMRDEHPVVQAELAAIELALEQYAQAQAIAPPVDLKARIMDAIQHAEKQEPEAPELNANTTKGRANSPWLLAASVALLALSGYLWMALQQAKQQTTQLGQQIEQLRVDLQTCSTRASSDQEFANLVRDPDTKRIELNNGKNVLTSIFNSDLRNSLVLDLSGVPAPSAGKYLQFWAVIDGKPVSMGMIDFNSIGGHQTFKYVANAQAFAISEEDNPAGNATPTTVIALGKTG